MVHLRRSTAEQLRLDQRVFDQSDFRVNDLDQWRAQHGAHDGAGEAPATEKTDGAAAGTEAKSDSTDAAKSGDSQTSSDPKKESTSKKKKGIHKLVPW